MRFSFEKSPSGGSLKMKLAMLEVSIVFLNKKFCLGLNTRYLRRS